VLGLEQSRRRYNEIGIELSIDASLERHTARRALRFAVQ